MTVTKSLPRGDTGILRRMPTLCELHATADQNHRPPPQKPEPPTEAPRSVHLGTGPTAWVSFDKPSQRCRLLFLEAQFRDHTSMPSRAGEKNRVSGPTQAPESESAFNTCRVAAR